MKIRFLNRRTQRTRSEDNFATFATFCSGSQKK
jgi:hypothetical protein